MDPKDAGPRWGGLLPKGGNPPGKEAPEAPGVIHQPVKGIWIEYHIGPRDCRQNSGGAFQ